MMRNQQKNERQNCNREQDISGKQEQTARQEEVNREAHCLMRKHGLIQKGWQFQFDHARARAGQCRYDKKLISLSRHFTAHASHAEITDTILHEIAHALTPMRGHDRVWRQVALAIGCKAQRCHSLKFVEAKYIQQCSNHCWKRDAHRKRKNLVCRYCRAKVIYAFNDQS